MSRNRNTDINGQPFAQTTVGAVWKKGKPIDDYDADTWRRDMCGKPMKFSEYGNTNSEHGWEVDHIKPVANGGLMISPTFNRFNGTTIVGRAIRIPGVACNGSSRQELRSVDAERNSIVLAPRCIWATCGILILISVVSRTCGGAAF